MEFGGHLGPMFGYCATLCKAHMDKIMEDYGITQAQTHVMIYLAKNRNTEITQRDIERVFCIKAPTVNGIVQRLEEKGLISRRTGTSDARCRIISITDKGAEMEKIFREGARANERRLTRGMSREEKETLVALMERVIANLGEAHK